MDRFSKNRRSEIMSLVRSKDTKPEMVVRRLLHQMGYRYRLHRVELPGRPDLVLPRRRHVVFVHGCFWHLHAACPRSALPKTGTEWWKAKLERNVARDEKNMKLLEGMGWTVTVVWECQTKNAEFLREYVIRELGDV